MSQPPPAPGHGAGAQPPPAGAAAPRPPQPYAQQPAPAKPGPPAAAHSPAPPQPQQPQQQTQQQQASFRPLNVRDALHYLDRVKQQFANEYEVYDQFLTIMKDFKTQNIDTPGVIDRVSNLFRDHPSLIQGFNTFLPPGYRIECHVAPGSTGGAAGSKTNTITVTTPMGITTRTQNVSSSTPLSTGAAPSPAGAAPSPSAPAAASLPPRSAAAPAPASTAAAPAPAGSSLPPARLPPLPHVRTAQPPRPISPPAPIPPFGGNRTLAADSWRQPQQQPAASAKSPAQAQAHPSYPGQAARPPAAGAGTAKASQHPAYGHAQQQQQQDVKPAVSGEGGAHGQSAQHSHASTPSTQQQQQQPAAIAAAAAAQPSPTPQPAAAAAAASPAATAAAAPAPQMEFNHAINYVNKIKNRFSKDPETYKTFLEILQTYQKDQRPIQEVYTQVTALFKEAPDLLDEFKAFLPDTTGATDPAPSPALAHKKPYGNPKLGAFPPTAAGAGSAAGQAKPGAPNVGVGTASGASASSAAGTAAAAAGGAPEKKKRAAPGTSEKAKAKRAKMQHVQGVESPPIGSAAAAGQGPGGVQQQQLKASSSQQQVQQQQQQVEQPPVSPYGAPPASAAAAAAAAAAHMGHAHPYGAPPPGFPGAPLMQSAYDVYLAQHRNPPLVQPDEFGFFDRVKKHLDDRDAYTEFLKLLNLFTQEIIDVQTLLSKSLLFIGGDDHLVQQFKDLVGWDPVTDGRVRGEDWVIDNEPVLDRPRVELHLLKSYGPSYRKLPDSEVDLACSGRGPLEWSVLNDEWVAFATWASEGSGAHRKNPYEEALYNSEQERHWYSYHLESMARTIAYLEPIAARLALMPSDERAAFKLGAASAAGAHDDAVPAGAGMIGGTAPSVYERIVRKIYGKDHGWEILQALEDNPAVAVPIVLARLKQKDEEWKRAEREWNKVWREVDAKNHYRALDHQGIPFKAIDKKTTTTSKSLTAEIESLRRDKQMKRYDVPGHAVPQHPSQPVAAVTHPTDAVAASLPPPLRPRHQFELHMANRGVLFDVLKLTLSYLDRDASGFSAPERARVEAFLRLFVPLLWGIGHDAMEAALGAAQHDDADVDEDELETEAGDATDADESGVENASEAGGSSTPGPGSATTTATATATAGKKAAPPTKRGGAADLRRRTLLHAALAQRQPGAGGNGAATTNGRVGGGGRGGSPATDGSDDDLGRLVEATWISLEETREDGSAVEPPSGDEVLEPRRYSFFANSTFYCLVRVMHQIYHRLLAFKQLSADLAASSASARRLNPLGVELGLSTPVPVVDTGDNPAEHYYEHTLDLAEKLFDGDVDQQTYEEQLRFMAGIRSYPLFTLDKLVSTVIKHIHTINSDNRCQDIVALLEKDRRQLVTTPRQQIAYRMEVESVLNPDENLYRLEWIPDDEALTIQLLGKEDLTLDDAHQSEAKLHQSWLASFQLTSPSEGIGAQVKAPLLKRNRVLCAAEDPQEFDLAPGLQAKERAYRLLWVKGSEDYLRRLRPPPPAAAAAAAEDDEDSPAESSEALARRRSERFQAWVDEQLFPERREERQAESDEDDEAAARGDELEGDELEAEAVELEEGEEVEAGEARGAVPSEGSPPAASSGVADAAAGGGDGDVEMDET
ncbi:uncharacterized protein RHOBADRAFT_52502 [Rhodotorula graminis WP1]|uniref:Histone deacetylase interacting domain-containing protein n=1 Tax=Rhodotorula graminis (strain WP1) TaxID=578459 RepID=A0A194S7N8_RHOGW|nr:uncharacterized protein RHOBADRAFT_52502 [Rhodotorula graminis WP1]KPV76505.1 hypothetical protein RHOBADRAFT_52502 [Rhodotorula graminis WP1]